MDTSARNQYIRPSATSYLMLEKVDSFSYPFISNNQVLGPTKNICVLLDETNRDDVPAEPLGRGQCQACVPKDSEANASDDAGSTKSDEADPSNEPGTLYRNGNYPSRWPWWPGTGVFHAEVACLELCST